MDAADQRCDERHCFLCGTANAANDFTDEHVFPASIGGELIAPNATCPRCNGNCSVDFEAKFLNSVKILSSVLGIANRRGDIPSIDVSLRLDGRQFTGVLKGSGELVIQNQAEQQSTAEGKAVKRYWLFDDQSFGRLQKAAARRGERLVSEEPGRDFEFTPESFMPLDFVNSVEAKRTAAKVALTCLAAKLGQTFVCSKAFDNVRRYIREGAGDFSRLFFNENFAACTHAGPFQHLVILSCDGQKHTVYAIVMFFGTMTYLVELSSGYEGIDFGAHYAFDARNRKEVPVFVAHLENERLAVEDVLGGTTRFDDVAAVAQYGARVIQIAASPRPKLEKVGPAVSRRRSSKSPRKRG
jgi:HNH endonuclease